MADNVTLPGAGAVVATDDVGGFQYQRVKVAHGADGSATDTSAAAPFPMALSQNTPGTTNGVQITALTYPSSTANNTTAQLAASATFTGGVENILSLQAAQIQVVCDQPYTVSVLQYIDAAGSQLISTDTFTRAAGIPLNENVTLPGNYFRVTLQNNGASATTNLRLDTTFGIMDTTPRSLSNSGNYKVAVMEGVPALTVAGSLAALNAAVTMTLAGRYANATFQIAGTWVGAITFEASNDGFANVTPINAIRSGEGTISQTATVNDIYRVTVAGFTAIRAIISAYTSGTAVITANASEQTSGVFLNFPLPPGANNIGTVTAKAADLWVTAAGASGAAVTLTLPAPAAGLFHYITGIDLQLYAAAARTGSATPVTVTTTNLPGSPAWHFPTAQAIGAIDRYDVPLTAPIKVNAAATATTIVMPVATSGIWRANVSYYTGP